MSLYFIFQLVRTNLKNIPTPRRGTAHHPNSPSPIPRKDTAHHPNSYSPIPRRDTVHYLNRLRRILNLAHLLRIRTPRDKKCILLKQPPVPTNIQVTQVHHLRTMKLQNRKSDYIHYYTNSINQLGII